MKVLIFSLAYPPFIGGAELAVKEITDRISGISFDMVTADLDGKQLPEETIGNVRVYRVGHGKVSKYFFPWIGLAKAKALHQQKQYDIVWAIMANQAGLAALQFKKKFPAVKYLLTLQEGDSLKSIWLRTWFMRRRYKAIYRRADAIQAISLYLKERAIRYGYRGPLTVVPNGVDAAHFSAAISPTERSALRQKLGINETDRVLITASRLVEKNGVDILIRALRDFKQVKLLIAGTGKLHRKLQALASDLGISNSIIFFGHIGHHDLPRYLQLADVFIRPSRSEGLGSAFLEAMAAGLPVIATPVGGIPDFLIDGKTGLFCAVNNPKDLANKIRQLLGDATLRKTVVTNGQNLVREKYDWQSISIQMAEIFRKL